MNRQSPHMNDALFAELLESVREGGAILRGEREASRTFAVDQRHMGDEPAPTPDATPSDAPASYPFKWTRRVALLLLLFSFLALVWLGRREDAGR